MTADPRIDEYIAKAAPFAQPILDHVRKLVHRAIPQVEEGIKWGMPHFMVGGKNVVGLAAFKAHAAIIVHGEDQSGEGMGSLGKLAGFDDLPSDDELIARFQGGLAALAKPRPKRAPKPELPVPDDLLAALSDSPQAKLAFEAFSTSHRREYIEWIAGAKREETRAKRIATTLEWLTEGKKRNWKYENC